MATRSPGPGIRVNRKRTFTVVFNDYFQPGMSMDEWGLFCHLLSKPDGWDARVYALQQEFAEGRDAIYTTLNKLVERGLMTKEEYRDGNLRRYRYVLNADAPGEPAGEQTPRSAPETDFQDSGTADTDAPDTDCPAPEDPPQVSKDSGSTELPITDLGCAATRTPPPRPASRPRALNTSTPEARIANAVYDAAEGMVPWEGMQTVARRALRVAGATEDSVRSVMCGVYRSGKPINLQVVGQVLSGALVMAEAEDGGVAILPRDSGRRTARRQERDDIDQAWTDIAHRFGGVRP